MKMVKILLQTVLPITIGSTIFILYFLISDKLSKNNELESCEIYELSNIIYLIIAFFIILASSLYQLILGNWILNRNKNKFVTHIINCIIFSGFFTLITIIFELITSKTYEVKYSIDIFLVMLFLGLLFSVLITLSQIVFKNKLEEKKSILKFE